MEKEVREVWTILGALFTDKKKAVAVEDGKSKVKKVFVVVDKDTEEINGVSDTEYNSWTFNSKAMANDEAQEYNANWLT